MSPGIGFNSGNYGYYPLTCLLFKTELNSIDLSVPHRKHMTSPLRAQQVNAIYRILTAVFIATLDIIHRPVFCSKHNISETGFCLRHQMSSKVSFPTSFKTPELTNDIHTFTSEIRSFYYILASCCTVLFTGFCRLCCRLRAASL
jgi:hypothetical protein